MPAPCPVAPDYYTMTLHIIAVISTPLNLFGLYLVIYQSPGMSRYKHCLCFLQAATFLTEFHMTWVTPAYMFFPLLGGYNIVRVTGHLVRSHLAMVVWLFWLSFELPAILVCFVYRHNAALKMRMGVERTEHFKRFAIHATFAFPFLSAFSFYLSELTYEEAFLFLERTYPQCLFWLKDPVFVVYDYNTNNWVAICGIGSLTFVVVFCTYSFALGIHTMLILSQFRAHMSKQTYQMHKNALISLTLQVVIPAVLIIAPLFFMLLVVVFKAVEYQEIAMAAFFGIASHSACSTTVMLVTNPRFRSLIVTKLALMARVAYYGGRQTMLVTVEPSTSMRGVSSISSPRRI